MPFFTVAGCFFSCIYHEMHFPCIIGCFSYPLVYVTGCLFPLSLRVLFPPHILFVTGCSFPLWLCMPSISSCHWMPFFSVAGYLLHLATVTGLLVVLEFWPPPFFPSFSTRGWSSMSSLSISPFHHCVGFSSETFRMKHSYVHPVRCWASSRSRSSFLVWTQLTGWATLPVPLYMYNVHH